MYIGYNGYVENRIFLITNQQIGRNDNESDNI